MTDRVLVTMDDLEAAVRANAAFEEAGFETVLVSSQDDAQSVFSKADPDVVVLTGALHEHRAEVLITRAKYGTAKLISLKLTTSIGE